MLSFWLSGNGDVSVYLGFVGFIGICGGIHGEDIGKSSADVVDSKNKPILGDALKVAFSVPMPAIGSIPVKNCT